MDFINELIMTFLDCVYMTLHFEITIQLSAGRKILIRHHPPSFRGLPVKG